MTITVEIPEELAGRLIAAGKDPALAAFEAIALERYRSDRQTKAEIRRLLGFDTRMEVDAFLKEHGVFLPFADEDLAHDIEIASQVARRAHRNILSVYRISGAPDDCYRRHGADQLSDSDWRN